MQRVHGDFAGELRGGARAVGRKMLPTTRGWAAGALRGTYAAACGAGGDDGEGGEAGGARDRFGLSFLSLKIPQRRRCGLSASESVSRG